MVVGDIFQGRRLLFLGFGSIWFGSGRDGCGCKGKYYIVVVWNLRENRKRGFHFVLPCLLVIKAYCFCFFRGRKI